MKKLLRWFGTLLILALVGGGVYWGYCKYVKKTSVTRFTTEPVTRSELSSTISATGTVEPEELALEKVPMMEPEEPEETRADPTPESPELEMAT